MGQTEPSSSTPIYLIGRNSREVWVVQDQERLRGGLFFSRAAALHFALEENGHQLQSLVMVPGVLELNISEATTPVRHFLANAAILLSTTPFSAA